MTPWVRRLIIANVAVFFVQFTLPGVIEPYLMFIPRAFFLQPWTFITYMFVHSPSGFSHILFNMLTLYFFGPRVEARLGERRFITLYLLSGIGGALLSLLGDNPILGASGAINGVMLAFAYYWPRDKIFIWGVLPIEARWLVIITTIASLYFARSGGGGNIAHYAHLGGYAGGFLYLWWLSRTKGTTAFKARVVPSVPERAIRDLSNLDLRGIHELNREELNRILDKINATGVNSLTPTEKTFLASFVPKDDRKPVS